MQVVEEWQLGVILFLLALSPLETPKSIEQLGHPDYNQREAATFSLMLNADIELIKELEKTKTTDLEIQQRIKFIKGWYFNINLDGKIPMLNETRDVNTDLYLSCHHKAWVRVGMVGGEIMRRYATVEAIEYFLRKGKTRGEVMTILEEIDRVNKNGQ